MISFFWKFLLCTAVGILAHTNDEPSHSSLIVVVGVPLNHPSESPRNVTKLYPVSTMNFSIVFHDANKAVIPLPPTNPPAPTTLATSAIPTTTFTRPLATGSATLSTRTIPVTQTTSTTPTIPAAPVAPTTPNTPATPNVPLCIEGSYCIPRKYCSNSSIVEFDSTVQEGNSSATNPDWISYTSKCANITHVCCLITSQTRPPNAIKPPTPRPKPSGCGYRNVDGISFKLSFDYENDNLTQFAEFPWMVAILKKDSGLDGEEVIIYRCGGSLIHPSVAMTAAHCVSGYSVNVLKIRAGDWDVETQLEMLPYQDRDVAEIVIHNNFRQSNLFNDIALLFLKIPFMLAENVMPVCLPPSGLTFDYRRCFATGWGQSSHHQSNLQQSVLKKIDLPIVPFDDCQSALRTTRLSKYFELHDSFMCAGGEEGKDTCNGDGGSPLVCPINGTGKRYYQTGIVSWGMGCGQSNIPGVYVNVAKFRNWVDEVFNQKGLNSTIYSAENL